MLQRVDRADSIQKLLRLHDLPGASLRVCVFEIPENIFRHHAFLRPIHPDRLLEMIAQNFEPIALRQQDGRK